MDYLSKSFNLTFLDLILIAIVGGLLVNLFSFIIKKISITMFKYIGSFRKRIRDNIEEIKYQKRILNKDINSRDMFNIYKKNKEGKATKKELEASDDYSKKKWDELSDEQKEKLNKSMENIRNSIKNFRI